MIASQQALPPKTLQRLASGNQDTLILYIPGMANAKQITYPLANQELRHTGPKINSLSRLQGEHQQYLPPHPPAQLAEIQRHYL